MALLLNIFVYTIWIVALVAVLWFGYSRLHEGNRISDKEKAYLDRQRRTDLGRNERW